LRTILCESLKAHPTLTNLHLRNTRPRSPTHVKIDLTDDQKAHRTRLLVEMMQRSTALHTVELSADEKDQKIYTPNDQFSRILKQIGAGHG
jgi:hypothetical protein